MTKILVKLLALSLFTAAQTAMAANYYVRAGATGANNGADWTNAYTTLPSTLTRGNTYYIADGSYSGYTFDDDVSGTSTITIKKCTASDHGTETGYSAAYCDGQAIFGELRFTRPYYVIDGAVRNESNWKDHSAYGIRTTGVRASRLDGGHVGSDCSADNITFKYAHVGTTTTAYSSRMDGEGFYISGFGGGTVACENWTLHRTLVQNVVVGIQCAGCKGLNVEYSYFYIGWGKEAIRGQVSASNMTVRYSVFEDSCQRDPGDATSGCTAEIANWDGSDFDNNEIYGNVFYKTTSEVNSGGAIVIGGNGSSWVGPATNNSKVYNNTIAGLKNWNANILINGGSGNECRNNLWYGNTGSTTGCTANSSSHNVVASSNPFVNYSGGDFRLAGATTTAGYSLPSTYMVDRFGATRGADGNWDLGAYEYVAGGTSPVVLSSPTNLRIQ